MTTTGGWITVTEAATAARRHPSSIYTWIDRGNIRARRDDRGHLEVYGPDVLEFEAAAKRGRPKGSARPPAL